MKSRWRVAICPKCGYKIFYRPISKYKLEQMSPYLNEGIEEEFRWKGNLHCPECGRDFKIPLLSDFL